MMDLEEDDGLCLLGTKTLLEHVRKLRKEIKKAKERGNVESVHRMRVASRRIRADMVNFGTCFGRSRVRKWGSSMRSVTKNLGEARDLDVQIEFLKDIIKRLDPNVVVGVEALLLVEQGKRLRLRAEVDDSLDDLAKGDTLDQMRCHLDKLVKGFEESRTQVRTKASVAACLLQVTERTKEILYLEDFVHREDSKLEHHKIRIAIKHLRYTLEGFGPLFMNGLDPEISRMRSPGCSWRDA